MILTKTKDNSYNMQQQLVSSSSAVVPPPSAMRLDYNELLARREERMEGKEGEESKRPKHNNTRFSN